MTRSLFLVWPLYGGRGFVQLVVLNLLVITPLATVSKNIYIVDYRVTAVGQFTLRLSGVGRELTETGSDWLTQAGLTAAIFSGS